MILIFLCKTLELEYHAVYDHYKIDKYNTDFGYDNIYATMYLQEKNLNCISEEKVRTEKIFNPT